MLPHRMGLAMPAWRAPGIRITTRLSIASMIAIETVSVARMIGSAFSNVSPARNRGIEVSV
jgi:hypothetical protein